MLAALPQGGHGLAGYAGCYFTGATRLSQSYGRTQMNKDQVKGVAEKVKGKVNEEVGKATDNPGRELKGDLQQGAGQARKDIGDMKEAIKDDASRRH